MAKKRGRRNSKEPRRQHLRTVPTVEEAPPADAAVEQQLMTVLRESLRAGSVEFLETISTLMTAVDSRGKDPFSKEEGVSLDELLESFLGVDLAETTAGLTVLRHFVADELVAARMGRELARRRQPMPATLTRLDEVEVLRVMEMTEVLGDGDDYFLDVALPGGEALTAVVYVDHNLGTVVKDAFLIPVRLDEMLERMIPDLSPDQRVADADAAQARAVITEAIDHGARFWPPLESDSWPQCRPLVEWLVRQLPAGGEVPARPSWDEERLRTLSADFFASTFGRDVDNPDGRALLESILWFGTDYGPGDPMRWSPVSVEILLTDWMPRKIVAEAAYLAKAPDLLRAFIAYCHHERGIRSALTQDTVAAVDHWEPDYQRLIRSDRPQGPAALLAGMLDAEDGYLGEESLEQFVLGMLSDAVGGRQVLMALDDTSLPDEPFEWAGIPEDIHDRVAEVLELSDRCADELLDVEHRTAMRRFLSRASVGDPTIFRRKGAPERAAAAVAWVITRANESVGVHNGAPQVKELLAWFGVKGSVSQRAEPFLKAVGVDPHAQFGMGLDLAAADLLVSARRRQIIESRDRHLSDD